MMTAQNPPADTSTAAPAADTTSAPAADTPIVDDFAEAFAELNAADAGGQPPEPTPEPTPAPTPEPTAAPAGTPPATPEPTAAPVAVSPEVAALQQQIADLTARAAALEAPPTPEPTPAPEVPLYTAEEQAILDKHKTEWSEVAAGEALIRRGEYRQFANYIFGQIMPHLQALSQSTQTVSSHTQYTQIKGLVSDYDEARDPCLEWIKTQPAYLKTAYEETAENGTPADIADMITRFKKETGWKAPAATAPAAPAAPAAPRATPAPTAAPAALSAEAKAAIEALKPVAAGRTAIPNPADPNDFDSAFAEFARV